MLPPTVYTNLHVPAKAVTLVEQKGQPTSDSKNIFRKSLRLNGLNAFNSAIARHLLDTGHEVDMLKSFKVINKQSNSNLLKFAEALAIKRLKPDLCIQKETVINLSLPW
ncbi:unnamed protein product [Schistosoma margrebowiei]|uniref:Uncharacterized protein n=1 Tax=Schistosoma margrebowiei TaxID=48269 RepID=A0A183NBB2_9TREM|nr:unnamed protein product [Schistosoma margrebowiei]